MNLSFDGMLKIDKAITVITAIRMLYTTRGDRSCNRCCYGYCYLFFFIPLMLLGFVFIVIMFPMSPSKTPLQQLFCASKPTDPDISCPVVQKSRGAGTWQAEPILIEFPGSEPVKACSSACKTWLQDSSSCEGKYAIWVLNGYTSTASFQGQGCVAPPTPMFICGIVFLSISFVVGIILLAGYIRYRKTLHSDTDGIIRSNNSCVLCLQSCDA